MYDFVKEVIFMYMNINVSTQERYIKQAQRKVLAAKYAKMPSTVIGGLVLMGICYMILIQVLGLETLTALPISVYVPMAIFNLGLFFMRKSFGRKLNSYEVAISEGKVTFINLYRRSNNDVGEVEIAIDLIDSIYKIESGYIIHFTSKTLWQLDKDKQKALRCFGLLDMNDDTISIFIPRMSFETFGALKKFNLWLSNHNLLTA